MATNYTKDIARAIDKLVVEVHCMNRHLRNISESIMDNVEHEAKIIVDANEVRRFFEESFGEDNEI
jgi:hypothetical protein